MTHTICRIVAAMLAASASVLAHAFDRSIYISPASMAPTPIPAGYILNPLPTLSGVGNYFYVSFMLPLDYKPNTAAKLRLLLERSGSGSCAMVFSARNLSRTRPGQKSYSTDSPTLDGMTNGNVTIINMPLNKVATRTFNISAPTKAPFTDQLAGDGITIQFFRDGTNPLDACNSPIYIWHAEVQYESTH
jgi:hypothetical protein